MIVVTPRVRGALFVLWCLPTLGLVAAWSLDALGANPLDRLMSVTGRTALVMLMLTLAVTPLRRLSRWLAQARHARMGKRWADWQWLIRIRRQMGLFAFFHAVCHVSLYVWLDAGMDLQAMRDDLQEKPFMQLGLLAIVLLVPLAATSTQAAMRALGSHWQRLHALSYPIAVIALWHGWWQLKRGDNGLWVDTLALGVLLGARAWIAGRGWLSARRQAHERASQVAAPRVDRRK